MDIMMTRQETIFRRDLYYFLSDKGHISIVADKRINDYKFINRYLEQVNTELEDGELFAGCFETFSARRSRLKINKIPFLRIIYFGFEFLFKRVLPKIKYLNFFYFTFTGGKDRLLSKAEVLGRLVSCGFQIEKLETIGLLQFFVVRKVAVSKHIENKNYGFIFKMKRVGKNGKDIYIYKIRTMHPFSEFLQDYVFETNGLASSGKLKDDFRLTPWGRVLRKFWLDELPQVLNLLKGDIKLVGPRPVSDSYSKLIPSDLWQERLKYKPGLIPPYVSLGYKASLENVLNAERIYLQEKAAKPYTTDMRYFFKAIFNILFRRLRSS